MKQQYIRAMDHLHRFCIVVSAFCLITMTLVIPYGVFMRYAMNSAAGWPEPLAILLMILFSFFAAAACYRDNLHIAVMAIPDMLNPRHRIVMGWVAEIGMIFTNLFMVYYGGHLVTETMHQVIGEFPIVSVGLTYSPIPIGGAVTLLFVIERLWTGNLFARPDEASVGNVTAE